MQHKASDRLVQACMSWTWTGSADCLMQQVEVSREDVLQNNVPNRAADTAFWEFGPLLRKKLTTSLSKNGTDLGIIWQACTTIAGSSRFLAACSWEVIRWCRVYRQEQPALHSGGLAPSETGGSGSQQGSL